MSVSLKDFNLKRLRKNRYVILPLGFQFGFPKALNRKPFRRSRRTKWRLPQFALMGGPDGPVQA
jgi:hypothetical protein